MKKLSNRLKTTLITDLILVAILLAVYSVSFFPDRIVPIYGGNAETAIYNGNRNQPFVSLMFNVYEDTETVNAILDVLKEHGAKATFFVGGCWADDNGQTLIRIVGEGHELGNHGYFHKDHKSLNYEKNKEEIYLTNVITQALCGVTPKLFAPPSGSFSETTLSVASELGLKTIMWSKDTIDWRDKDSQLVYKRATEGVTGGDLILMHPKKHTLQALGRVLEYYESISLTPVTVSENIKDI